MFVTVIVIYKFAYPQDDEKKFEFILLVVLVVVSCGFEGEF